MVLMMVAYLHLDYARKQVNESFCDSTGASTNKKGSRQLQSMEILTQEDYYNKANELLWWMSKSLAQLETANLLPKAKSQFEVYTRLI